MADISRRTFGQQTLGSLLTFSLLESLFSSDVFADAVKPVTARWLKELNDLGQSVKDKKLEQVVWQKQVESLFDQVNLPELLKFVDFEKLVNEVKFRRRGETSLRRRFPEVEGLPTRLVFGHQIFALQKDRSVVPHGHDNMATAFLVLRGDFRGRHYERLADEGTEHMIIKPSIDRSFTSGEYSTVSDHKDNVHWFKATSETGFIFNIHVTGIDSGRRSGRVYVDPNGEKLSDGRIRARRLKWAESRKLYG